MAAADRTGKSPAFQFYPKDYLGDEEQTLMSLPETGAYIRLMCRCWLKGSLPSEIPELAKLCGASVGQMSKFWPAVSKCFKQRGDGRWIHLRLDEERRKQAKNRAARSENGKLGGRPRKADAFPQESKTIAEKSTPSPSPSSTAVATKNKNTESARPIDAMAQALLNVYPKQGACSIHAVTVELGAVLGLQPSEAEFVALLARLDGHKASAKWAEQGGRFIPRLDRYLKSGTHLQVMPSAEDVERDKADAKLPAWARSSAS